VLKRTLPQETSRNTGGSIYTFYRNHETQNN